MQQSTSPKEEVLEMDDNHNSDKYLEIDLDLEENSIQQIANHKPEDILNNRFESIRLDFRTKLEKIKVKNEREMEELEDTLLKEKEKFAAKQEQESVAFQIQQDQEKCKFEEKQNNLMIEANNKAVTEIGNVEKAIGDIHSPFREGEITINTRSELECPVCLVEMKPPVKIWQCIQGHAICGICKIRPECNKCPTCRQRIMGRAILLEKIALGVFGDPEVGQPPHGESQQVEEGDQHSQIWTFPSSTSLHSGIRFPISSPAVTSSFFQTSSPSNLSSSSPHEGALPRIPPSNFRGNYSGGSHCRQCGSFVPSIPGFIHVCRMQDNHF